MLSSKFDWKRKCAIKISIKVLDFQVLLRNWKLLSWILKFCSLSKLFLYHLVSQIAFEVKELIFNTSRKALDLHDFILSFPIDFVVFETWTSTIFQRIWFQDSFCISLKSFSSFKTLILRMSCHFQFWTRKIY